MVGRGLAEEAFFSIQVGAYKNHPNAMEEVKKFKDAGHSAYFRSGVGKGDDNWFRVYVGRFGTRGEAEKKAKMLMEQDTISSYHVKFLKEGGDVGSGLGTEGKKPLTDKPISPTQSAETSIRPGEQIREGSGETERRLGGLLEIRAITFSLEKGTRETLLIHSDREFSPSVLFSLKGENPMLRIDIDDTKALKDGPVVISANGGWIKQVRPQFHAKSGTLTLFVDLFADRKYRISQDFDWTENIYSIEVSLEEGKE